MTASNLRHRVTQEVEALHQFLEGWLNGSLPATDEVFADGIANRLHPMFSNIQPAGIALTGTDLLRQLKGGHGASPAFRIRIRNAKIQHHLADTGAILATYEEFQKGARNSARADNARLSSVLFSRGEDGRLVWLHLHETWLPDDRHLPGLFEF